MSEKKKDKEKKIEKKMEKERMKADKKERRVKHEDSPDIAGNSHQRFIIKSLHT